MLFSLFWSEVGAEALKRENLNFWRFTSPNVVKNSQRRILTIPQQGSSGDFKTKVNRNFSLAIRLEN